MATWLQTKFPGLRFREHPTRKHGLKPDRYFAIRFQHGGRRVEEGLGWASEGWTEQKAAIELAKLKEAAKTGEGPSRLSEKREVAEVKRRAREEARKRQEREAMAFAAVWQEYFAHVQAHKSPGAAVREEGFYRLWIAPAIADKPMRLIAPLDLERMKKRMLDAGRTPRTAQYALAVVRQVFNFASRADLYDGKSPLRGVSMPKRDNKRLRFFTQEEAERLLAALGEASAEVQSHALMALHCGMRFGEIAALTWGDVDLEHCMVALRDTKSGQNRHIPMTARVRGMLETRKAQVAAERKAEGKAFSPADLVFPARGGKRMGQISKTFEKAVAALGLNDGIEDPRQRLVFHSCRHSFASWLVMNGTPLYTVAKLMGHSTLSMTERYSHLAPDHMKEAVRGLEQAIEAKAGKVVRLSVVDKY